MHLGRATTAINDSDGMGLIFLSVLSAGTGVSMTLTLIPIFALQSLRVTSGQLGIYYAAVGLASAIIGLLVGRSISTDRNGRMAIVFAAVWVTAGLIFASTSTGFGTLLLIGVAFLSFIDVANGQTMALARRQINSGQRKDAPLLLSLLRSVYSAGYVIGPLLVSAAVVWFEPNVAILLAAALYLPTLLAARTGKSNGAIDSATPEREESGIREGSHRLLVVALGLCLILMAPTVRSVYLPVLAIDELSIGVSSFARILAVAPVAEIVFIPLAGLLASKWGARRVVVGGSALAVIEMVLISQATTVVHLAALQVLGAVVLATLVGVGVTFMQDMAPAWLSYGTSLFFSARATSGVLGSLMAGSVSQVWGVRASFLGAGLLVFVGTVVVLLASQDRESRIVKAGGNVA